MARPTKGVMRVFESLRDGGCGAGWVRDLLLVANGLRLPIKEVLETVVWVIKNFTEESRPSDFLANICKIALQPYYLARIENAEDDEWTFEKVFLLTEEEAAELQSSRDGSKPKPPGEAPYTHPEVMVLVYSALCQKYGLTPVEVSRPRPELLTGAEVQNFLNRQEPAVLAYNICARDHQVLVLLTQVNIFLSMVVLVVVHGALTVMVTPPSPRDSQ